MHQRLFEIVWLLTETGGATAAQMAQRFGVSRRTIYRDIDALSGAGIPVYTEKGRDGGIRLLPDFVLDKALFSKDERTQLVAHLDGLAQLGTPDTQGVLDKLSALFGRQDSWLEVDFSPWGGGEAQREFFRLLRQAILTRQEVSFLYTGAEGEQKQRLVRPLRMIFRGQGWYLYGYCLLREDFRFFKLNRMEGLENTGQSFAPMEPPTEEEPPYMGEMAKVRLRLGAKNAFRVYDEFSPQQCQRQADGSFIVETDFPLAGNWLPGYLLSFGADTEVLSPPALREKIKALLAQMLESYA